MGLHRRAVDDPQPGAGAIGGSRRGHRGTLQPLGHPAGGHGGGILRGTRRRLAGRREHADRFHQPVGRADAHTKGRGVRQQVGSLGRPHPRLRRGRPGADPGGAPLAGRRHAPDLDAAGGQQRGLRGPLLRDRVGRPQAGREPLSVCFEETSSLTAIGTKQTFETCNSLPESWRWSFAIKSVDQIAWKRILVNCGFRHKAVIAGQAPIAD